jgi:hypothetical protein
MNLLAVLAITSSVSLTGASDDHPLPDPDVLAKMGDVALDNWPQCDFFVVHTKQGFSLVMWRSGMWVFGEGDDVYGRADRIGPQSILLAGPILSGQMNVEIEAVGVDLSTAQDAFYKRCKIP